MRSAPAESAERRRLRAAIHESGHCVAAWALNHSIDFAEIGDNPRVSCKSITEGNTRDATAANVTMRLCGGAAEEKRFGSAKLSSEDEETCDDIVHRLVGNAAKREFLEKLVAEARAIVSRHWDAVERVAEALIRYNRIDNSD